MKSLELIQSCKIEEHTSMNDVMAANRRTDPNFSQVSGFLPRDVALQFKIACTAKEISMTEGLEQAVMLWLKENAHQKKSPATESKGK